MAKVIDFPSPAPGKSRPAKASKAKARKKAVASDSPRGSSTLCKNGHHKWQVDKDSRFDTKQGKLVTREQCLRCGKTRVSAR